jgi:hypothetical protein
MARQFLFCVALAIAAVWGANVYARDRHTVFLGYDGARTVIHSDGAKTIVTRNGREVYSAEGDHHQEQVDRLFRERGVIISGSRDDFLHYLTPQPNYLQGAIIFEKH